MREMLQNIVNKVKTIELHVYFDEILNFDYLVANYIDISLYLRSISCVLALLWAVEAAVNNTDILSITL